MKLYYEHNGQYGILYSDEDLQNENGYLNDHFTKCSEVDKKIRMFVHSHKHHVLREYYSECKASGLALPQDPMNRLLGKPFAVGAGIRYVFAHFFSDAMSANEYLMIIVEKHPEIEIVDAVSDSRVQSFS